MGSVGFLPISSNRPQVQIVVRRRRSYAAMSIVAGSRNEMLRSSVSRGVADSFSSSRSYFQSEQPRLMMKVKASLSVSNQCLSVAGNVSSSRRDR